MFIERMETVNVCRVEEVKNKEIHLSRCAETASALMGPPRDEWYYLQAFFF